MGSIRFSMLAWASRDLARRPGEAVLTGLALGALVAVAATILLLVEAWTSTTTTLIEKGPSLVVRHLDAGGWKPLPAAEGVAAAEEVVGVVRATPRVWGAATGPAGAVTVMGVSAEQVIALEVAGLAAPSPGAAVLGPGVLDEPPGDQLGLVGSAKVTFRVQGVLDRSAALVLHDVVLLEISDARELLGLGPDEASDLAVEVFHEAEEEAILPDLASAFPFPVRITTRREAVGAAVASLSRDGGLGLMLLVPTLLAMGLFVATAIRIGAGSRREIGLYKSCGWTTGELVRLELTKSLAVGVPGILLGLAVAWVLVFWPGITWPGALLLGWRSTPPPLTLDAGGAVIVLLGVAAFVLAPWLLASIVPAVRSALADPGDLVRGGGR